MRGATRESLEVLTSSLEDDPVARCGLADSVRAYRPGFPRYAAPGPEMLAFVRRVTADEGRHFRDFLELVRAELRTRADWQSVPDSRSCLPAWTSASRRSATRR